MLRVMWERAARTILNPFVVLLKIPGIARAMLDPVHRTIAEQTVEVRQPLMAGEIFAVFIFKKFIGVFHIYYLYPSIIYKVCAPGTNLRVKLRTSSRKSLCSE